MPPAHLGNRSGWIQSREAVKLFLSIKCIHPRCSRFAIRACPCLRTHKITREINKVINNQVQETVASTACLLLLVIQYMWVVVERYTFNFISVLSKDFPVFPSNPAQNLGTRLFGQLKPWTWKSYFLQKIVTTCINFSWSSPWLWIKSLLILCFTGLICWRRIHLGFGAPSVNALISAQ